MMTPLFLSVLVSMFATLPPLPVLHPHVPRAIVVGGAGGKATLLYFTVPVNTELMNNLKPGFQWHLGYALLTTEVPLKIGEQTVAAGGYKCDVRRGDSGEQWSVVLINRDVAAADAALQRAKRRNNEQDAAAAQAKLDELQQKISAGEMVKEYVVPLQSKKGDASEHLALSVINRGYVTERRGSDVAVGGIEFTLRIDYGDVHEELEVAEVFGKDANKRP